MTWHRFVRIPFILGFIAVWTLGLRQATAATLPNDVRTATNAASIKPKIAAFLEPKIVDLGSAEGATRSAARDAIVAEVAGGAAIGIPSAGANAPAAGAGGPTAAFFDAYADVLAEKLDPLAGNSDPRIRLNVAVIAAKVGEKANNQRLMQIVVKLLADENDGVVLWAIRASKFIIPSLLSSSTTARTNPLIPAFTEAAKGHIKSGPITQASYEALRIEQSTTGVASSAWPTAVQVVAPVMLELMTLRLDQYKDGQPEFPSNETTATTFLTDEKVWKAQSPPTQLRTVQLTVNLIQLVAEKLGTVNTVEGNEFRKIIQKAAGGLTLVGRWVGEESQMKNAVKDLTALGAGIPVEEVQAKANALVPALKKIKAFQNIQPTTNP